MSGWPKEQTNCSECVQPYWNYRDEMTVQNGFILKGTRIVIRKKMKLNILERLHSGHLGQEKCKRRARATVFWPGMNKDIEKMVNLCSDCIDHRAIHCSRVNKHLRLDKIAKKGFSPEISSFVPFMSRVENPHKSLHGKCPIFTKIQHSGQPT